MAVCKIDCTSDAVACGVCPAEVVNNASAANHARSNTAATSSSASLIIGHYNESLSRASLDG